MSSVILVGRILTNMLDLVFMFCPSCVLFHKSTVHFYEGAFTYDKSLDKHWPSPLYWFWLGSSPTAIQLKPWKRPLLEMVVHFFQCMLIVSWVLQFTCSLTLPDFFFPLIATTRIILCVQRAAFASLVHLHNVPLAITFQESVHSSITLIVLKWHAIKLPWILAFQLCHCKTT